MAFGARPWSWHTAGGLQADRRAGLGMALQPLTDDPQSSSLSPCASVPVGTCHRPGGLHWAGGGAPALAAPPSLLPEHWAWGHWGQQDSTQWPRVREEGRTGPGHLAV